MLPEKQLKGRLKVKPSISKDYKLFMTVKKSSKAHYFATFLSKKIIFLFILGSNKYSRIWQSKSTVMISKKKTCQRAYYNTGFQIFMRRNTSANIAMPSDFVLKQVQSVVQMAK